MDSYGYLSRSIPLTDKAVREAREAKALRYLTRKGRRDVAVVLGLLPPEELSADGGDPSAEGEPPAESSS